MDFIVTENAVYYGSVQTPLAEITFPEVTPGVYCIDHTFVDPSLGGQGMGGKLVQQALAAIRAKGGQVTATCSFAKAWLEKHPDA